MFTYMEYTTMELREWRSAFPGSRDRRIISEGNTRTGRRGKGKARGRRGRWSGVPLSATKKIPKRKQLHERSE